jgi:3-dehydroquinate dehydratase-1
MSASQKTSNLQKRRSNIVGTIPSPAALACALKLRPGAVDAFELRVDHFAGDPTPLLRAAPRLKAPLIVTVRSPLEGGANRLNDKQRRELLARFFPFADALDLELRSAEAFADTIAEARACKVAVILSCHDFRRTPSIRTLAVRRSLAKAARADIFKVATLTNTPTDLRTLLGFLTRGADLPLSVMGMGKFGKISRLLFAQAGSVLNYGYLDTVQVPGQWPAVVLKERLAELAQN